MTGPAFRDTRLALLAAVLLLPGCAAVGVEPGSAVELTGTQAAPPVATAARGSGRIRVWPSWTVTGGITVSGMQASEAHIHLGAPGANGPALIALTRTGPATFVVPRGAALTDAQYASYQSGDLYVSVTSAAHPGGEVRAQIPWYPEVVTQTMRPDWSY